MALPEYILTNNNHNMFFEEMKILSAFFTFDNISVTRYDNGITQTIEINFKIQQGLVCRV